MTLQQRCEAKIEESFVRAEKFYGKKITRVPITFSKRMTATAGKAFYIYKADGSCKGQEIRLSVPILNDNAEAFIAETPAHEAAHIISVEVFGKEGQGHGHRWKEVMRVLGLEPKRTHSFKYNKRKSGLREFEYIDSTGVKRVITSIRHNRLQKGTVQYYHWKGDARIYAHDFQKEVK